MFAVAAALWIAACYYLGMVFGGLTAEGPAVALQDACARDRIVLAQAAGTRMTLAQGRAAAPCRSAYQHRHDTLSAPVERKGLLWGVLPVVFVGGLLVMRGRTYGR